MVVARGGGQWNGELLFNGYINDCLFLCIVLENVLISFFYMLLFNFHSTTY